MEAGWELGEKGGGGRLFKKNNFVFLLLLDEPMLKLNRNYVSKFAL